MPGCFCAVAKDINHDIKGIVCVCLYGSSLIVDYQLERLGKDLEGSETDAGRLLTHEDFFLCAVSAFAFSY